jgi:hypothetical protein
VAFEVGFDQSREAWWQRDLAFVILLVVRFDENAVMSGEAEA